MHPDILSAVARDRIAERERRALGRAAPAQRRSEPAPEPPAAGGTPARRGALARLGLRGSSGW
ncbi:hypothetical protein ACFO4E_06960 [Nocardiopsis mangrovi]|uniref:Uncharacterized protein n=1 Tax=Nocardiopsis mangrovi TaxID=1179818 RepID=A0ABV9DSA9_9ACTN